MFQNSIKVDFRYYRQKIPGKSNNLFWWYKNSVINLQWNFCVNYSTQGNISFYKPICSATTCPGVVSVCVYVCMRTNMPTYTHRICTLLEIVIKLIKENEITGVCSRITVFLFNDRIKNKCPLERNIQSQKLYNVTC